MLKPNIRSLTREELTDRFKEWQQPSYRVDQLLEWVHARRAVSWDAMSNLPKLLRTKLQDAFDLDPVTFVTRQGSRDSTQKFLWRLNDGALIESVLIPANPALYGEASDRNTLCVSTQVGCAYGCKFCASGLLGWRRNLRTDEIIEQVFATERWLASNPLENQQNTAPAPNSREVDNLVVMGMGEPLANYDALLKALRILNAPWGGKIGARKITISTSGLAPEIRRLAMEQAQFRLAVSLHAPTNAIRNRIMPVNRKYPLEILMDACEVYLEKRGRMISFEYILIAGVNDQLEHARLLVPLAARLNAKVNLIPYNPVDGLEWSRPSEHAQDAFLNILETAGVSATLRREKGGDIDAACGQLRLKAEQT